MKQSVSFARCFSPFLLALSLTMAAAAQIVPTNNPPVYGPYNVVSVQGGDGVHNKMVEKDTVLRAESPWTMYGWVYPPW